MTVENLVLSRDMMAAPNLVKGYMCQRIENPLLKVVLVKVTTATILVVVVVVVVAGEVVVFVYRVSLLQMHLNEEKLRCACTMVSKRNTALAVVNHNGDQVTKHTPLLSIATQEELPLVFSSPTLQMNSLYLQE